ARWKKRRADRIVLAKRTPSKTPAAPRLPRLRDGAECRSPARTHAAGAAGSAPRKRPLRRSGPTGPVAFLLRLSLAGSPGAIAPKQWLPYSLGRQACDF